MSLFCRAGCAFAADSFLKHHQRRHTRLAIRAFAAAFFQIALANAILTIQMYLRYRVKQKAYHHIKWNT